MQNIRLNKNKEKLIILFFILPALLLYTYVVLFPIFQSVRFSLFENWNWINDLNAEKTELGFGNFIRLFVSDRDPNLPEHLAVNNNPFPRSIANSFILVLLSVGVQLPIALFFALLLAKGVKGEKGFRTIYFIPVILSSVVVGLLWQNVYKTDAYLNGQIGILNALLLNLGVIDKQIQWLVDDTTALICAMIPIVWQYIGQHMLLMYAGAKSVPKELYEAAEIDGASPTQVNLNIVLPLMKSVIQVSVIWAVTGSLKAFDQLYALLGQTSINDPNKTVPSLLMYKEIRFFNFGYSSAMAVFIVAECLILTFLILKLFSDRKENL
jgi:raffinose/stachyose/melibiose transport system permease protein